MEENDVKSTCGGTRLDIKIEKHEIFFWKSDALYFFQFKIWRVIFFVNSKSDTFYFFLIKIWHVSIVSIQNLTSNENFNTNSCFLKKSTKNAKYVNFTE